MIRRFEQLGREGEFTSLNVRLVEKQTRRERNIHLEVAFETPLSRLPFSAVNSLTTTRQFDIIF